VSSWLITVTVRECWKLRQKSARTVALDDPSWESIAESVAAGDISQERQVLILEHQHLIRRGIEQLSSPCRDLIEKLFYSPDPLSYAEIGEQLGMPIASVGPTRGRCLAKLKSLLTEMGFR